MTWIFICVFDCGWQAEDCNIRAEILSINRGGALVNFEGLRGFLPVRCSEACFPQQAAGGG